MMLCFQWGDKEPEPRLRGLIENSKLISRRMKTASFWSLDLEVVTGLLHLWLILITLILWLSGLLHLWANFIAFMVSGFITFVVKSYYIHG